MRAQDKNQSILLLFFFLFFQDFTQLSDSRKIHYLPFELRIKLHLKTDITLIASRFMRYRFSRAINMEFPHQGMNYYCIERA